jgi:hypothetical protein
MTKRLWGAHAGTGILGSLPVNIGHWLFYYFLDRQEGYNPAAAYAGPEASPERERFGLP